MKLYEIVEEQRQALAELAEMEDLDPQIIEDSMAAINQELEQKVLNCAKYLKEMEAEAKAIKEVEQAAAARRKAIESKVENFKEYIRRNMVAAGLEKSSDAAIKVSITKPLDVVVLDDEGAVPSEFVKVTYSPMKAEIKKALKDGVSVPGARIDKGQPGLRIS